MRFALNPGLGGYQDYQDMARATGESGWISANAESAALQGTLDDLRATPAVATERALTE